MPIYEYKCTRCNVVTDQLVSYDERNELQYCPECETPACAEYQMSAPILGGEQYNADNKLIWDERQLEPHWRDKGTTGKEGGAGRKLYFHD